MPSDPEYMREYRAQNPGYAAEDRRRNKARRRAQTLLAELYPADFERLFAEELRKSDPNQRGR